MKYYDGIHWNVYEVLTYNRRFNFINGIRKLGKTYTLQMMMTDKAITTGCECVYIVRTQDEKKEGILEDAFSKVLIREFSDKEFKYKNYSIFVKDESEDGEESWRRIWVCLAISEYIKIKKKSFPLVEWGLFDEYMLENPSGYIDGWQEADHLLSIYDTIDRGENRLKMFFIGNNTAFHNPYHLHPFFAIPRIEKGELWKNKFVLFQRPEPSKALLETMNSDFDRNITGTEYAQMYREGDYLGDNTDFIGKLTGGSRYIFTLCLEKLDVGVYFDSKMDRVVISQKVDKTCNSMYAVTIKAHKDGAVMVGRKGSSLVRWLGRKYRNGRVMYENMDTKLKAEKEVNYIA